MKKISLDSIKSEIKKSGASKGKFLFIREDSKVRVRFLTDFEDGFEIKFHDSFQMGINVPCQEEYGRDCPYCEMDGLRTRPQYIWSVYDYESKEVKLLMAAVNNCSPVPTLASLYDSYGTLLDRDLEIKRIGKQQNTTYSIVPLDKMKFRNEKAKPYSAQAILKFLDKAYPVDVDIEEDEEEEVKPKKNKTKVEKKQTKKKVEPVDEWDDEEPDFDVMSAKELYDLCKKQGVDCEPRKKKEYYIDLLTQNEDEWTDDEWDEPEEDEDEELPWN